MGIRSCVVVDRFSRRIVVTIAAWANFVDGYQFVENQNGVVGLLVPVAWNRNPKRDGNRDNSEWISRRKKA